MFVYDEKKTQQKCYNNLFLYIQLCVLEIVCLYIFDNVMLFIGDCFGV